MIAREVLLRTTPLRPGKWLFFLVVCVCGALSACYELVEWAVAVVSGSAADSFLGTQGDPWDTQKDMALAFIGAIAAQMLLSRLHDRQLKRLRAAGDADGTQ
jgi:putative membrane protein